MIKKSPPLGGLFLLPIFHFSHFSNTNASRYADKKEKYCIFYSVASQSRVAKKQNQYNHDTFCILATQTQVGRKLYNFYILISKIRVDFKAVHVIIKTLIFVNFISFRNLVKLFYEKEKQYF